MGRDVTNVRKDGQKLVSTYQLSPTNRTVKARHVLIIYTVKQAYIFRASCDSQVATTCLDIFSHFTARRVCIARTMPWQDICLSICLSVRLSVTCQYSVEMVMHILKLFHHQVATTFQFSAPNSMQ